MLRYDFFHHYNDTFRPISYFNNQLLISKSHENDKIVYPIYYLLVIYNFNDILMVYDL